MSLIEEWSALFAPMGGAAAARFFRIVPRAGNPLLLLPSEPRAAAHTLNLYSGLSARTRILRALLKLLVGYRFPLPLRRAQLPWDSCAPLPRFIAGSTGVNSPIGVLLGNPRAPGRRLVILTFRDGAPFQVIKAGTTLRARELIEAEVKCLGAIPRNLPGVPAGFCGLAGVSGFAVDFVSGETPPAVGMDSAISALLSSWLDPERLVRLPEVPSWARLRSLLPDLTLAQEVESEFQDRQFVSTIAHGDFTPWNIRCSEKGWTALDWERGELCGVPGWDWLHYIIQAAALVERCSPSAILSRVQDLFRTAAFQSYATRSRIAGVERAILRAYLAYAVHVVKQTEGLQTIQQLLTLV